MAPTQAPRTAARYVLWLTGLLLTLSGLIAMHGLGGHGVPGSSAHEMRPSTAVGEGLARDVVDGHGSDTPVAMGTPSGAAGVMVQTARPVADAVGAMAVAVVRGSTTMDGHSSWAMVCMATLVGLSLALLRGLTATRSRWVVAASVARLRPIPVRGRDPDTPSLSLLSVRRC